MVITILEAKVAIEKISSLRKNFLTILKDKPPSIVKTYLLQEIKNPGICKIVTVWKSTEDLKQMQKKGTPAGVLLFREFGAEPILSVHEIIGQSMG